MNPMIALVVVIAVLIALCVVFYLKIDEQRRSIMSFKSWKRSRELKYQRKQGTTKALKDKKEVKYDLRSFDGGKNWYACEESVLNGLNIIGRADDVYSGIVRHLHSSGSAVENVNIDGHLV